MAYAFEREEPIPAGIRRLLEERIAKAEGHLLDSSATAEERIHGARKRFKESRAVMRLIRPALGDSFTAENVFFRDLGRELSAVRDAQAIVETTEKLIAAASDRWDRRVLVKAREELERRRDANHVDNLEAKIEQVLGQIPVARARVGLLNLADDFETIGGGLQRTVRDGKRAMDRALSERTPESFHEWRKRVKDHWYHLQILRHVWPEGLGAEEGQMELLSDALGDHHDLVVLQETVRQEPRQFGSRRSVERLLAIIARRQAELEATASSIGRMILSERAGARRKRIEGYWRVWSL
jgi:CHAD domain-containing protein